MPLAGASSQVNQNLSLLQPLIVKDSLGRPLRQELLQLLPRAC